MTRSEKVTSQRPRDGRIDDLGERSSITLIEDGQHDGMSEMLETTVPRNCSQPRAAGEAHDLPMRVKGKVCVCVCDRPVW